MPTWTNITKPGVQTYTGLAMPSTQSYINVVKPVGSIISNFLGGGASGLIIPLTFKTSASIVGSNWTNINKPS